MPLTSPKNYSTNNKINHSEYQFSYTIFNTTCMSLIKDNKTYYPALDGLRGVAILFVLLYHNFNFTDRFFFGWLGVDLFFVLSGFLITSILLNTRRDPRFFRNFYARRALRIFPLYFLILVIFLVIFPAVNFYQDNMEYYNEHQLWFWIYIQNWLLSFHTPPRTNNVLTHLWSLAVEEQFYVIWPLAIYFLRKIKWQFIFMLVFLISVITARAILWSSHIPDLNYTAFYTFTRVDGIAIGSLIALMQEMDPTFIRKNLGAIVATLAGLNFLFYFLNVPYGILPYLALCGYTTFAIIFGLLINEIVTGNNKFLNVILSNRPLIFLGKISYGLYVFHWPVFAMLSPLISGNLQKNQGLPGMVSLTIAGAITTLIALLLSTLSYYTFEKKFLSLKERFR